MAKKRFRSCLGCGCGGVLVLAAIGAVGYFVFADRARNAYAEQLRLAAAEGLPVDGAAVARLASEGQKTDVVPLYKEFAQVNSQSESPKVDSVGAFEPGEAERFEPVFPLAERIADAPRPYFGRGTDLGADTLFPEYADVKKVVRLFTARAQLRAAAGDAKGAFDDLDRAARVTLSLDREPFLIGLLVRVACEAIVLRAMEGVLSTLPPNLGSTTRARETLAMLGTPIDLRRALGSELAMFTSFVEHPAPITHFDAESGQDPSTRVLEAAIAVEPVRKSMAAHTVEFQRNLHKRFPADVKDWQGFHRELQAADALVSAMKGPETTLTRIFTPVFSSAASAVGRLYAARDVAIASVGLIELRAAGRPFPSGIPAINDAYGHPMRYQSAGNGFKIWSIGEDGVDDGGDRTKQEIVWEKPLPKGSP